MSAKPLAFIFFLLPTLGLAESTIPHDPCTNFLALINRPTVADSACVVKPWDVVIESGLQYGSLYPVSGHGVNYPDTSVRLGLPYGNEINVTANYFEGFPDHQPDLSGVSPVFLGYKHQFQSPTDWLFAGESIFSLPSGSYNFGSHGLGVTLNGLASYFLTKTFSVEVSLGIASLTVPDRLHGGRYKTFNPDIVLNWEPLEKFVFYFEVFGQTKVDPELNAGYNAHIGMQYLIRENIEIDFGYGRRLHGELNNFEQYFGLGAGILF